MAKNFKKFESKAAYDVYRSSDDWWYPAVNFIKVDNDRIVHYNNELIMRWDPRDTVKTPTFFGDVSWEKFKDWVDNASRPCEIPADTTDPASDIKYLDTENFNLNTEGEASHLNNIHWLQMAEIENINIGLFEAKNGKWREVRFNFDKGCPKGFHKWFPNTVNGKKLIGRYDTAVYDDTYVANNRGQTGTHNLSEKIREATANTNPNLLSLTYWEYHVLVFIFCAYYKTFDVQSVCDGLCWASTSDPTANNYFEKIESGYPNGWIDTRVSGHAGKHILSNYSSVSGHNNEAYKFMWLENPIFGKNYLRVAGCNTGTDGLYFCYDDIKANHNKSLSYDKEQIEKIIPLEDNETDYCKDISLFGHNIGEYEAAGSSSGFFDCNTWNYSSTDQDFCESKVGGDSTSESAAGGFCRNFSDTVDISGNRQEIRERLTMNFKTDYISPFNNPNGAEDIYDVYDSEIEYLRSTGTQYIDCDYIPNGATQIEIKVRANTINFKFVNQNYTLFTPLFGVMLSASNKFWAALVSGGTDTTKFNLFYYNCTNVARYPYFTPNLTQAQVLDWQTYTINKTVVTRDGSTLTASAVNQANSTGFQYSLYLFEVNDPNDVYTHLGTSTIDVAYFKVKDGRGEIVRDMIPVRIGDKGYMYDKVSKRLFGNQGTGNFVLGPDKPRKSTEDFVEVDYLESTGTQYIDTGIYGTMDLDFYIEFEPTELGTAYQESAGSIFGSRNDWNKQAYQLTTYNKVSPYSASTCGHFLCANNYGWSDSRTPTANILLNKKNIIKKENLLFTRADGTTFTLTSQTFTTPSSIRIFQCAGAGEPSKIKLYNLKFSCNGNILRDFIPVRVGTVGYMYDRVSKQFFGNAGTGGFILGPDKPKTEAFTEVEYLESTGTQYIDTGVQFTLSQKIWCKFQNTDTTSTSRDRRIFGGASGWKTYGISLPENNIVVNNVINNIYVYSSSRIYNFYYYNKTAKLDNTSYNFNTSGNDNNVPTITLFAEHRPNSISSLFVGRIYSFKVDGIIDLIPVRVGNVGYMYDKISGQLFGNAGTGNFVVGSDKPKTKEFAELDYLESTGTQYIDLGRTLSKTDFKFSMKFEATDISSAGMIFSGRPIADGTNAGSLSFLLLSPNFRMDSFGATNTISLTENLAVNTPYEVEYSNGTLVINGESTSITSGSGTASTGYIYLFGGNNTRLTKPEFPSKIKLYYAKFYQKNPVDNTPVFDLIPVRVGQTGYMYDKVSKRLFGNQGTGNFVLGPDKPQPIEYLQTTGTQYFTFPVNVAAGDDFEVNLELTTFGTTSSNYGIWDTNATNQFKSSGYSYDSTNRRITFASWLGTASAYGGWDAYTGRRGSVVMSNTRKNGGVLNRPITAPFTQFKLFSDNIYTNRVFSLKIKHNGEIIYDLVPVKRNGVGYLCNKVDGQLYSNSGSGDFILGPNKVYDSKVEYLESSGSQFIDTEIDFKSIVTTSLYTAITKNISTNSVLFGAFYDNGTIPKTQIYINSSQKWAAASGNGSYSGVTSGNSVIPYNKYGISVQSTQAQNSPIPARLFERANDINNELPVDGMRLYSCAMKSGDTWLRNFIPVRVGSTGYLYDDISGKLFGNPDSNNKFIIGPDKGYKVDRMKELGCIMWFPLDNENGLNDVIGDKQILVTTSGSFTWVAAEQLYYVKLGAVDTSVANIPISYSSSDFVDQSWTVVTQARRYTTSSSRGAANVFVLNNSSFAGAIDSNGTAVTGNWTTDNIQQSAFVCSTTGRTVYRADGTSYLSDSTTYPLPWEYSKIDVASQASYSVNKYTFVRNFALFNRALTQEEVVEVYELINI